MENKKLISSESLKRVIIRFDYSGSSATSIQPWIDRIKIEHLQFFQKYDEAECGEVSIDMSHPERITMDSGVGIKEMIKGPLHVFQNGKLLHNLKDEIKLEISHFYMSLTINCIDYQESLPYRDFMCMLMSSLLEYDKFVRIKRFGIRKLDLFSFQNEKDLKSNLSPAAMNFELHNEGKGFLAREFIDQYLFDNESNIKYTLVNYRRVLRNTGKELQAIIDMDCFRVDIDLIRPDINKLQEISKNLNDKLYMFFEGSMTEEYKKSHEKK